MKAFGLMYHDVVEGKMMDNSGFIGPGPSHYKLNQNQFDNHLSTIQNYCVAPPSLVTEKGGKHDLYFYLTFDDGGVSAHTTIADALELRDWRGHFLITAKLIGDPGFLTANQIRDLHERGHVIGSHSYSHPDMISNLSFEAVLDEWNRSTDILSNILGKPVVVASLPGGYYASHIAKAASEAGIQHLFVSEPTTKVFKVDQCHVYGRFAIFKNTPAHVAARLASANRYEIGKQFIAWNSKKILKQALGKYYLIIRRKLLSNK